MAKSRRVCAEATSNIPGELKVFADCARATDFDEIDLQFKDGTAGERDAAKLEKILYVYSAKRSIQR